MLFRSLHKESKVEFDDEAASLNLASITTAIPQPNALVKTIKFGFFEPIVLAPTVEEVKNPQGSGGNTRSQINANDDDEGWTLVIRRRSGKKNPPKLAKAPTRSKMVR